MHLLSTWRQSRHDSRARCSALESEHAQLVRQRATLGSREALEAEARRLGMMRKGEQPYVVSGLPHD